MTSMKQATNNSNFNLKYGGIIKMKMSLFLISVILLTISISSLTSAIGETYTFAHGYSFPTCEPDNDHLGFRFTVSQNLTLVGITTTGSSTATMAYLENADGTVNLSRSNIISNYATFLYPVVTGTTYTILTGNNSGSRTRCFGQGDIYPVVVSLMNYTAGTYADGTVTSTGVGAYRFEIDSLSFMNGIPGTSSLNNGLLFYLNMNETSGLPKDYSNFQNDATNSTGIGFTYSGNITNGIAFTTGSKFTVPHISNYLIGTGDFTYCWFGTHSTQDTHLNTGKDSYADSPYSGFFHWTNSGTMSFTLRNSSVVGADKTETTGGYISNEFYLFCGYRTNGTMYASITNSLGTIISAGQSANFNFDNNAPIQIGSTDKASIGSLMHEGIIAKVGFWNRALNTTERIQLYNNGQGLPTPFVDVTNTSILGLCRVLNITYTANDTFELIFNNSEINFNKVNSANIGFAQGSSCSNINLLNINNNIFAEWYKVTSNTQMNEQIIGVRPNWSDTKILFLYNMATPITVKNSSCNNVYSMVDTFNRADSSTVGPQTCGANAITWSEAGCTYSSTQCGISSNILYGTYINAAGGSWSIDSSIVSVMAYANSTSYMVYRNEMITDKASSADSAVYIAAAIANTANYSYIGFGGIGGYDASSRNIAEGSGFSIITNSIINYPPTSTWFKREMFRNNQTTGGYINNVYISNITTNFSNDSHSRFDFLSLGHTYDGAGLYSPINTYYDNLRVFRGVAALPVIGIEQDLLLSTQTINVTTDLIPNLLYTNTSLQAYCNINIGDNTNLTLSYELRKNNVSILNNISNATSGIQYNLFNYTLNTNDYGSNYSLYCNATNAFNSTGFITSQVDKQVYDLITYNMSQFKNNTNLPYFPEIGDIVQLNGSVTSRDNINVCQLQINATGTWIISQNQTVNSVGNNLNVPFTYVITNNSNANNSVVYWKVICNDTVGTQFESNSSSFNVTDIVFPAIIIGPDSLNINSNNRTVFSRDRYNMTYNITYFDYNLFAVEINVTCDLDGQVYYWSNTSILIQNYTAIGQIPLNTLSFQKCNFFTAASDSHTDKNINDYQFVKLKQIDVQVSLDEKSLKPITFENSKEKNNKKNNATKTLDNITKINKKMDGFSFNADNNLIQIFTDDVTTNINTQKEFDRYTFDFEFQESKNNRYFKVLSDKPIYYIYNSKYKGHFIVWDKANFKGNWIDFEIDGLNNNDYTVTQVSDYEYNVKISNNNKNLDKIKFKSIGGTTITNYSLNFYIGGDINVDSNNSYDGSRIAGFNYQLITTDGINNYTGWINGNGTIQNVSAGNYNITFSNSTYFMETETTALTNASVNITVNGFQNQYNFIFRNVKTLLPLYNVSYNIINTGTGWNSTGTNGNSSPLIRYLNNGTYNISWFATGYDNMTATFSASTLENRTLTLDTSFLASFVLYDEKQSTLTGSNVLFNIANATSVSFLLFCPGETRAQIINSTNFTIPITCNYNLFEFLLNYGASSYYRAFIIAPDDAFNIKIYLIDLSTTPYLFNSLVADDLLSKYVNPRIFVKKIIGNETVQITANFVDIEQKIGAYLIENNQYIVEIYSDNLPVYVIGNYFADATGTKSIRLYEVSIYSDSAGTSAPSLGQITVINATEPNSTLFYRYQDDTNLTTSVTFNVYQNNNPTPICTDTLTNNNNFLVACPITGYNTSKITVEQTITRAGQTSTIKQIIKDITEIQLGIIQYVGTQAQINWFLIIIIASLALFGTIQTANLYTLALLAIAVLFNIFGWIVMSTSVLAFAIMVALIAIFKEGDKVN